MKIVNILIVAVALLQGQFTQAQCDHDPTITGDTILCPQKGGELITQAADAYQWYKRPYGSTQIELITGATSRTLELSPNDRMNYYTVEATANGCMERSPEKLVDGYAFLPVTVSHSGKYNYNGNQSRCEICYGDTMYLRLNLPYDTNITWFRDNEPITDATSVLYAVTTGGRYTVSGAPTVCPDLVSPLGLTLNVEMVECSPSGIGVTSPATGITLSPNPATDHITLTSETIISEVNIFNCIGQLVVKNLDTGNKILVNIASLPPGSYRVVVTAGSQCSVHKLVK
jgi:hypothetical protein